jgi:hypothetical protein
MGKSTGIVITVSACLVVAVLTVPHTTATADDSIPLNSGLILHYTFDDCDATDSSPAGNHGTLMNSPGCGEGVIGDALEVRGSGHVGSAGDHVLLPTIDFMNMDEFTISLWVRYDGLTTRHGESFIRFGAAFYGVLEIGCHQRAPDDEYHLKYCVGETRDGQEALYVPWDPNDTGRFVLFSMTYQEGVLRAFKDGGLIGELEQAVIVDGPYAALARHWWNQGGATSTRLNGAFDDVRIYNRALTSDEIQRLFTLGFPIEFADLTLPALTLHFTDASLVADRCLMAGQFRLGEEHDGVDPENEEVIVAVGSSEIAIPAGSFVRHGFRYDYGGTINGVSVTARFEDLGSDLFDFTFQAEGMGLSVTANPVAVSFRIGNDFGEATEHLRGWLSNQVTPAVPW